ncbi:MAG: hypothetical protein HYY81_03575, partial [Deltaproteobacteria bacterium]|nr:hypothetical protein [Deltaproteobacteria bacterium]
MKTIKDMPEHSRPREKLREKGAPALTDEELVAAILGRGMINIDVRTMARQVVNLVREHSEGEGVKSAHGSLGSLRIYSKLDKKRGQATFLVSFRANPSFLDNLTR